MSVIQAVEEVGPCRQKLTIEVPGAAVEAETDRVVGEYRRRVRLPGFRKGKAPKEIVTRRFGKEIRQEVIDRLVPRYWHQAQAEKKLDPLLPPSLEGVDFELGGGGMSFTAVVETRPEVALGELGHFELPDLDVEPAEDEVTKQLEDLQRRAGTWQAVERGAARGDRVAVEVQRGDQEPNRVTIEVGDERVWEELSLAVTGLAAGQQSSFERATGEGEKESFAVRVETVEELEPAPLDDELAKTVSTFETVEELRAHAEAAIRNAKVRERNRRREQVLLHQLRERYPLQLPEGVVYNEVESMVREYAEGMARQGVDLERNEIDWARVAEQVRPEAERSVHSRLLLDAIADEREIQTSDEKLESVLASIAKANDTTPLAVRRKLDADGRLTELKRQLRRQHVVESLIGGGADPAAGDVQSETSERP